MIVRNWYDLIILGLLSILTVSCSKEHKSNQIIENFKSPESEWNLSSIEVGNLDFGLVDFNKQKLLSISILNDGDESISSLVTIDSPDFSLLTSNCNSLAVGQKCTVKVAFNSKGKMQNLYTGNLNFGPHTNILSAQINRAGVVIDSYFVSNSLPILEYNFGNIDYSHNLLKSLFIKNNGNSSIISSAIVSSGSFQKVYDSCSNSPLAPGGSCLVKILLSGQGNVGPITSSLSYNNKILPLLANVKTQAELAQENSEFVFVYNNVEYSANPINLQTVNLNVLKEYKFYLKNIGTKSGLINSYSLLNNFDIFYNSCDGKLIAPNQTCYVRTHFQPQSKGTFSTTISADVDYQINTQSVQWIVREPGDRISCVAQISHAAVAELAWTGTQYTLCEVISCESNYHKVLNTCEANTQNCSDVSGTGYKTWNGAEFNSCLYSSCNSGYYLSGQSCVPQICIPNATDSCTITGGTASHNCNDNGSAYGTCNLVSCNSGFYQVGNTCQPQICSPNSQEPCSIDNGTGSKTCNTNGSEYGSCNLVSCIGTHHPNGNSCDANVIACSDTQGTGTQTWNTSSYGNCQYSSCNSGYYLSGNSCLPQICSPNSVESCTPSLEATGSRTCNTNGSAYGSCSFVSCNPGFYETSLGSQICMKIVATGGDQILTDGDYKIHVFNSTNQFQVSTAVNATVEYLVIAGGGGGGGFYGAGGGAGGYRTASGFAITPQNYTMTVGTGGSGSAGQVKGVNGQNSVFSSITSIGGGGGAYSDDPGVAGNAGGSGGGGGTSGQGQRAGGAGTPGQGNSGGYGSTDGVSWRAGGGGGGAGSVGGNSAASTYGGGGGAGLCSTITGPTPICRAGGGGGGANGSFSYGVGGNGGGGRGGNGSLPAGVAGQVNTGSGGGGAGVGSTAASGGLGGSGVIIIRYKYK